MSPTITGVNEEHPNNSGHVLILGAGFSHAVNEHLPLANELGRRAFEVLARGDATAAPSFSNEYAFETHLSFLAESQPHLTEVENRENESEFARLLQAIVIALDEQQTVALADPAPRWFSELVSVLHYGCYTVITLNYDTLIEAAVASQHLDPHGSGTNPQAMALFSDPDDFPHPDELSVPGPRQPRSVTPDDLLRGQPPQRPHSSWPDGPGAATMRLLKLHGSLDWWWVPRDQSGATLSRHDTGSRFGAPVPLSEEDRSLRLPGRERFLIPPLSTKSPYYRNPITRQLWQDAYRALCSAKRISLVGYSLPLADIVMSGMLRSAIREGDGQVTVDIVNRDPTGLQERVIALSPGRPSIQPNIMEGGGCVESFAGQLGSELSMMVGEKVGSLPFTPGASDGPAYVAWHQDRRPITRCETTGDGALIVITDDESSLPSHLSVRPPYAREVSQRAKSATRIVARNSDGSEVAVVSYAVPDLHSPNLVQWLQLLPAG